MEDSSPTALFNALPYAVLCCSRDGRVVAATDTALALIGATRAALVGFRLGLSPWMVQFPTGQQASFTELPTLVAIDEVRVVEGTILGLRHERRHEPTWLRVRAAPVNIGGERSRLAWLHLEVASRMDERAVPGGPAALAAVIDSLPVPALALDRDAAVFHANGAASELIAISAAELIGHRLDSPRWHWRASDGSDITPSELPFIGRGGLPPRAGVELAFTNAKARHIELLVHARPFSGPDGEHAGTIVVLDDSAARMRAAGGSDTQDGHQGFFERNLSVMLLIDPEDGRIVDANPAACEFYGWSRGEMLGMRIRDVNEVPDEAVDEAMAHARRGDSGVYRVRHRLATGEVRDVEVRSSPIRVRGKAILHAIVFDITDRLRAEAASLRSGKEVLLHERIAVAALAGACANELLRLACAGIGDALELEDGLVLTFGTDYSEALLARAFGRATALDGSVLRCDDLPVIASLAGDMKVVALSAAQSAQLGPLGQALVAGGARSLLVGSVVVDAALAAVMIFASRRAERMSLPDIQAFVGRTAARVADALAAAGLERVRRQLLAAIEKTDEVVVVTDTFGNIVYTNPAFEKITGFATSEVLGAYIGVVDGISRSEPSPWRDRLGPAAWRGRTNQRRKDGSSYVVDAVVTPVQDPGGPATCYVAVLRDITRELDLERQMLQAQKMEGIGRLAGGIAHDFNNTLAAVMGYAGLVRARIPADHPAYSDVLEIQDTILRSSNLSRQLLTFARRQVSKPRPLDLGEVILTLDKMLRRLIGEDVELVTVPSSGLWTVMADPGQVEQIVVNLVVNARDAMPKGGKLVIETTNVEVSAGDVVTQPDAAPGPYVLLSVTDTGTGMSEETKAHMFEPFFTTKEPDKGTGLGLATCFGIAHQSGGFIVIDSRVGWGTCARVYFPKDELSASEYPPDRAPSELPDGDETILVAEDDPVMRRLAVRLLQAHGYQVLLAANGEEALRVADAHAGPVHLLLTDVVMPRMGAQELIREMHARRPETRVVVMSGYPDDAELRAGAENRRIPFLGKPFTELVLVYKIREVLDGWPVMIP